MKKLIFLFSVIIVFSCNQSKPTIGVVDEKDFTQTQIDSIIDEYNFVYTNMSFIDSTSQVLFPIATRKVTGRKRYKSYDSEIEDYPRYWNILFYNSDTNETRLLTNSKMRITDFEYNIKNSGPILKDRILYEIGDTDYNQDKKFNYEDPIHLFISNIDGSDLIRISPLNEDLESYQIVPNTDKIIFRTRRDANSDLEFDKKDERIWYQIDVSEKNSLIEIIKATDRKLIEKLYFEQWLIKK